MHDHRFTSYQTEADSVKQETNSNLPAHKIRALIEIVGRDTAIAVLEDYDL